MASQNTPPLVVHLLYRLDVGGLETLLIDCINRMPAERYRHAVICLTDYTAFAQKITRPGVEIYSLHKAPGLSPGTHVALWKLLRKLRPSVLHTYNLAAIEYHFLAALAGVPLRIHAEHGRDASDPDGTNKKHNTLRRWLRPLIHRFVPVSADLQGWLKSVIGVPERKNTLVPNGVDTDHFAPAPAGVGVIKGRHFPRSCFVIGTVGRVQDVKNHRGLVQAFIRLREKLPTHRERLRLVIIGDGPCLPAVRQQVADAGLDDLVWLPGARSDIRDVMRTFSVFALSSIAEGTPVTILEAMATGLPIVATRVGGIPEVVQHGRTGMLAPASDADALADALAFYVEQPALLAEHGLASRRTAEARFSIDATVAAYLDLYDGHARFTNKLSEPV